MCWVSKGKSNSRTKQELVRGRDTFPPFAMKLRRMGHPVIGGWWKGITAKAKYRDLSTAAASPPSVEMTWFGGGGTDDCDA